MNRSDRLTGILKALLIILGLGVLIVGGMLAYFIMQYSADKNRYESIRQTAYGTRDNLSVRSDSIKSLEKVESIDGDAAEAAALSDEETIDFDALHLINEDIAGWLYACSGDIDGPVVQAQDDEYYLNHLFDGSDGMAGTFFADRLSAPAFECPLTVIYGHNRKDGSMFRPLIKYKDPEYYAANPGFIVYTPSENRHYRIFSVFYADQESIPGVGEGYRDGLINDVSFGKEVFEEALSRSLYETLPPDETEKLAGPIDSGEAGIVVLCTCEYSGSNNRMVVFGVSE